ncbi:MAG: MarR family transcriptional regulator [Acidobacteriota bacterium]|nr:MarR family transcriptional regulator [Acidobacteriota bacterium]
MGEALRKRVKQARFNSPAQEALINLLIAASHVREQLDAACCEFGITHGQYNVLRILRGVSPNGYARNEITERMIEKAPDVTRLVDRLEQQGLVERRRSGEDRRQSITGITQKGLDLIVQVDSRIKKVHEDFRRKVSVENCRRLSQLCESIYGED